jgi:hypothetical protein
LWIANFLPAIKSVTHKSAIGNPQFAIRNSQSLNPQIGNPQFQSAIRNSQFASPAETPNIIDNHALLC